MSFYFILINLVLPFLLFLLTVYRISFKVHVLLIIFLNKLQIEFVNVIIYKIILLQFN